MALAFYPKQPKLKKSVAFLDFIEYLIKSKRKKLLNKSG
jgi:hypothetical protein